MKPTYLGIGAQKCASTWIHNILEDHPQVAVGNPKELNFFTHNYDKGFQWYENHFYTTSSKRAVGEISPSYFYDLAAPLRAYKYNPGFKIIVTLRDPVERMYSNHLHEVRLGHYQSTDLSFEAGLANNPMYLEQSRYATHLKHWLAYFRAEQILVLLQEDIQAFPTLHAQRLYEFLGIDCGHVSRTLGKRANESRQLRLKSIDTIFKQVGKVGRATGMSVLVSQFKNTKLISGIRNTNSISLRKLTPPMLAETQRHLEDELAEEVHELANLLHKDSLPWPIWESVQREKNKTPQAWRALAGKGHL